MVVPGFFATDRTTLGLQRALGDAGYRVSGWGMGWSRGVREDTLERLAARIEDFGQGTPAILVGWRLGCLYARQTAMPMPYLVATAVPLGPPFSADPPPNHLLSLSNLLPAPRGDPPH